MVKKTMQHLSQKTHLLSTVYAAATLTMLSGIAIYWILFGFDFAFISSSYGFVLSIGSLSGIIGWFIAVLIIRRIFGKMKIIGGQIQASGTPPSPEQASQMQALVARLGKMGKTAVTFLLIALLGMSTARFVTF